MLISMARRVARALIAETEGVYRPSWSIDQVAQEIDAIRDTGKLWSFHRPLRLCRSFEPQLRYGAKGTGRGKQIDALPGEEVHPIGSQGEEVKVALVTGAAAGIGAAISRRLAREGIAIGVLDLLSADAGKVAQEIVAAGGKAIPLQASITDRAQVKAASTKLREAFGPVTILVNNAGITGFVPFEELTDAQWDKMMEVNLKGTFIVTQVALPDMKAAGWGRIVNISSSSAQSGAVLMAHYSASKGAIIALTKTLARELGPLGITCNNIPPRFVMNTVMSGQAIDESIKKRGVDRRRTDPASGRARRYRRSVRMAGLRGGGLRHRSDHRRQWRSLHLMEVPMSTIATGIQTGNRSPSDWPDSWQVLTHGIRSGRYTDPAFARLE